MKTNWYVYIVNCNGSDGPTETLLLRVPRTKILRYIGHILKILQVCMLIYGPIVPFQRRKGVQITNDMLTLGGMGGNAVRAYADTQTYFF